MQTEELGVSGDGSRGLIAQLTNAIDRARAYDYDLPTEAALRCAHDLFLALEQASADVRAIEVSVGIDGSIDLFASNARRHVSVEINPRGRLALLCRENGESTATAASIAEIVREISRAA